MSKVTVSERRIPRLAAALVLPLILASACVDETTITDVTADRPVLHVVFNPAGGALPGGGFDLGIGFLIDLTLPDAFDRATGDTYRFTNCVYTTGGAIGDQCWVITTEDALGADRDGRLPALSASDVSITDATAGDFLNILGPEIWGQLLGVSVYNYWTNFVGVPANQRLYVGLWRAAVQVNEELDVASVLTGATITAPDQLVSAGGAPGGAAQRPANGFDGPYPAEPNANPWVFGYVESDEDGVALMDVLISPYDANGAQVHNDDTTSDPALWPFAVNGTGEFQPWQYNYVVVWAEDPLANPDAEQVMRIQLAPDVQMGSLNAANNTFAPYPAGALGAADIAAVSGFQGAAPNRVELELANLPALTGSAVYKAWLVDVDGGGAPAAATGLLTVTQGEQSSEVGTQATWSGGSDAVATFAVTDETIGGELRQYTHVLVTVESGDAGSPGTPAFWARFTDHNGTPDDFTDNAYTESAVLEIGSFNLANPSRSQLYAPGGTFRGSFFKDTLFVRVEGATPAPAGFHYEAWLEEAGAGTLLHIGPLGLDERGNGTVRIPESQAQSFGNYTNAVVTLEPDPSQPAEPSSARVFASESWIEKFRGVFRQE